MLKIILAVDAFLFVVLMAVVIINYAKNIYKKNEVAASKPTIEPKNAQEEVKDEPITEDITEPEPEAEEEAPIAEENQEEPVLEEKEEEPQTVDEENIAEETEEQTVAEERQEPETIVPEEIIVEDGGLNIGAIDDSFSMIKRVPFAEKMLSLDIKTRSYYDKLFNEFCSYKKVHGRVSFKCVSFRFGRELLAKINVRGKTMKLYLALDVNELNEKLYFQKDSSEYSAYKLVPFTVKVKSERGLNRAVNVITYLAEKKGFVKNPRYKSVNAIAALKDMID